MSICTNFMKFKFKCNKRSRFEKKFARLLRIHSSFYIFFLDFFFKFSKFSKFEFKNHQFLISDQTDPGEFQKMWPNFLTLNVGKYLDIFSRESEKSASKQLSHLHYENLQILRITAPQFFI
jgi:hypothetical protein